MRDLTPICLECSPAALNDGARRDAREKWKTRSPDPGKATCKTWGGTALCVEKFYLLLPAPSQTSVKSMFYKDNVMSAQPLLSGQMFQAIVALTQLEVKYESS
jgi:hypothetical protein